MRVCVGQVDPEEVFALPALSVQDIRLGVKALNSGSCFRYLNVVDVDTRQLVASWLLCLTCRQPVISRVMTSLLPQDPACLYQHYLHLQLWYLTGMHIFTSVTDFQTECHRMSQINGLTSDGCFRQSAK